MLNGLPSRYILYHAMACFSYEKQAKGQNIGYTSPLGLVLVNIND